MKTYQARDSVSQFMDILQTHHMGFQFRLPRLLERLDSLGVDATRNQEADDFTRRVREHAIQHVLCDMKNRARIPVPRSYLLVGVADEGPAYTKQGYENVFQLGANQIFGPYILYTCSQVLTARRGHHDFLQPAFNKVQMQNHSGSVAIVLLRGALRYILVMVRGASSWYFSYRELTVFLSAARCCYWETIPNRRADLPIRSYEERSCASFRWYVDSHLIELTVSQRELVSSL